MSADFDAVVVGAGIAGLAAARTLEEAGASVLVLEAADAPGGVMRSDEVRGYRIERGPSTVRMKPALATFAERTGVMDAFEEAAPAGRERFLLRGGALVPVPLGPVAFLRTPLLSGAAKRRLLLEPFRRRGDGASESVAEFASRRLGAEIVEALLGPFLTGIYAGDETRLGAEAVLPALVEYEREHGSIVRGALAGLRPRDPEAPKGRSGTWGGRGGMGAFSARVAATLKESPRFGATVKAIASQAGGHCMKVSEPTGEREVSARSVVLATDAPAAASLLRGSCVEAAAGLARIEYSPIVSAALGVERAACATPPRGFGFLVPKDEGHDLLGCLYMSRLFEGRAPAGHDLLHCMLAGARNPELVDAPDETLKARSLEVVSGVLGLRAEPELLRVQRWPRAVAQPRVGHPALIREIRAALPPGLELAGAYLEGVAVADAVASGVRAAERLVARNT